MEGSAEEIVAKLYFFTDEQLRFELDRREKARVESREKMAIEVVCPGCGGSKKSGMDLMRVAAGEIDPPRCPVCQGKGWVKAYPREK